MFANRSFVRSRRRTPEAVIIQFVLLAGACFVCLIGVVAFMHFSSPEGRAASTIDVPSAITSDSINIIVPIDNIQPGTPLDATMFRIDRRPQVVVGPEIVREADEIKNLYTRGLLVANQPVNRDLLTSLRPTSALTASIPAGYRAVSIPVDAVSSVQGWAQPGARVDVVWVTEFSGEKKAAIIAPNSLVLSANRRTEGSAEESGKKEEHEIPSTVTLLLPNKDAMKLRLASLNGRLSLILHANDGLPAIESNQPTVIDYRDITQGRVTLPEPSKHVTVVTVTDPKTGKSEKHNFDHRFDRISE